MQNNAINKNTVMLNALKALLLTGRVSTQKDIAQALAKQGILATQTKISRLLRKIGAVKIINDQDEASYSLARELLPPSTQSSLAALVLEVTANEIMIVIRTNPGSASLIAGLLDHHQQELEILGTIAGDDTLFVAPKSTRSLKKTLHAINELLINR